MRKKIKGLLTSTKVKIGIGIFVIAIVILILPIILNFTIFTWRSAYTNVGDANAWLGFIATYYGGIVGGLISGLFTYVGIKMGFSKADKDKFLDSFMEKEYLLRISSQTLANECIGMWALLPNNKEKLIFYRSKIPVVRKIYDDVKFLVGARRSRGMGIIVDGYCALENKIDADGNDLYTQNISINEQCELQKGLINSIYQSIEKTRKQLSDQYDKYNKNKDLSRGPL